MKCWAYNSPARARYCFQFHFNLARYCPCTVLFSACGVILFLSAIYCLNQRGVHRFRVVLHRGFPPMHSKIPRSSRGFHKAGRYKVKHKCETFIRPVCYFEATVTVVANRPLLLHFLIVPSRQYVKELRSM